MSAKTSTQPGRRTPLSLSGTVTKNNPIKSGNNSANGGGNNANGHTTSNTSRQDNKLQQQKNDTQIVNSLETKENPNKRQQLQADKKQQQNDKKSNEKNQNGVSSNKQQQSNENKQQQQNKEKQQQSNINDDNKLNEKDKKEKPDKLDKQQDKSEKEDNKSKENKKVEQDKPDNKKEEKKSKEVKDAKDEKKEDTSKSDAKTEQQQAKIDEKQSKEENQVKIPDQKPVEKVENTVVEEEQETPSKSTPATPKANIKASKPSTPVNNTPTKVSEKTPQKSTPNNSVKTTSVIKREVTTTIDDDVEMEPLTIESSPVKKPQPEQVTNVNIAPAATSTPGKIILQKRNSGAPISEVQLAMQTGLSPERPRTFSQISGRKSIRQISDYTPSKFQSNLQFRESYRRINTELDATNTSMNVTVGSEVPNNLSFSFFGRGRKRDRTPPPHSQSAIGELNTDMEVSPPKKARLDIYGFFSVVSSPLALLRNRFSKASLQSSTPIKLHQKLNTAEDEIEVQNVSGVSVHEEIAKSDKKPDDNNSTANDNNGEATLEDEAKENNLKTEMSADTNLDRKEFIDVSFNSEKTYGIEQSCEQMDIKITETLLQPAVGDPMAKNKRCIVM